MTPLNPAACHTSVLVRRMAAEPAAAGWKPQAVSTDNGSEFRSQEVRRAVQVTGAQQRFSRAGRPQTNSCVERVQGTILDERWRPPDTPGPTSGPPVASHERALGRSGTCGAISLAAGVANRADEPSDAAAGRREVRHAGRSAVQTKSVMLPSDSLSQPRPITPINRSCASVPCSHTWIDIMVTAPLNATHLARLGSPAKSGRMIATNPSSPWPSPSGRPAAVDKAVPILSNLHLLRIIQGTDEPGSNRHAPEPSDLSSATVGAFSTP